ncbi:endonuclease domain-containing protein [Pelagibacterium lacus]|uniref:Endonuclease domain-containing protein n=1 Tax=Pelagibacterium lacus TaxID=2282655 RepID=A0A369W5T6_9HYPH|nr:endonuclease domain-containing protein [Pelagibacterium lacus]RDE08720.1 endonuclease domain-containing protein [Pelagibacterium lacus]
MANAVPMPQRDTSPLAGEDGRGDRRKPIDEVNKTLAQRLRAVPTDAEIRMWRLLFPYRTGGYHFRKQVQIGAYVADFACHHAKVIIEVDGGQHFTAMGRTADAKRDGYLKERGYDVLRFSNIDVLTNSDGVLMEIDRHLRTIEPRLRKAQA